MSLMTKVMQKVQEKGATEPDAPETSTAEEAGAAVAEQTAFTPDDAPALPEFATAGPTLDEPGMPAEPAAPPLDNRTCSWDAQRVDPVIIAYHDRYSSICEQYRSVRARLLTLNPSRARQIITISSAIPEEGKSVSTINLSLVMAEGGELRVLIADADFRRTSIARMLSIPGKPGLAEVLRGEVPLDEALQPTPYPNLKVLPAGEVRDNAFADLLSSPNLGPVLQTLRERFDYTFADTPPVTTVSDISLLAPQCDGTIMVVEMRRTPEPTVQQAVRTLQANNVKILGCMLSRSQDRGTGYYDHYYSYYYGKR